MPNQDQLIKEFKEAKKRYRDLFIEIIKERVPGVINPEDLVAAKCDAGDSCHGGSNDIAKDFIIDPAFRKEVDVKK
jgi:hypothetical protein